MRLQNQQAKDSLITRLRRVEGQARGVQQMLTDERDCREIMQQLASIHAAVQSVGRVFFQEYAAACLAQMDDPADESDSARRQQREQLVRDMIAMLDKTP